MNTKDVHAFQVFLSNCDFTYIFENQECKLHNQVLPWPKCAKFINKLAKLVITSGKADKTVKEIRIEKKALVLREIVRFSVFVTFQDGSLRHLGVDIGRE